MNTKKIFGKMQASITILFVIGMNIVLSTASIHFDNVLVDNGYKNASKQVSSTTLKIRQKQDGRSPLARPRRDHQYATYKVPKHHMIADYGWNPRQLSSFATTNLLGPGGTQGAPPSEYQYPAGLGVGGVGSEEDNVVAAGGHGHSQQGWGWGHSQGHKYKKSEVNSSAVGMLGFLALLALVQNVLRQMNGLGLGLGGNTGVTVPPVDGGKRKRRSITDPTSSGTSTSASQLYETTAEIVPHLLRLNQIREGEWPLDCSTFHVCKVSQTAAQGVIGQNEKELIKRTITSVIGEMLAPLTKPRTKEKAEMRKLIDWAARVGLKGEKCDKHFKDCKM